MKCDGLCDGLSLKANTLNISPPASYANTPVTKTIKGQLQIQITGTKSQNGDSDFREMCFNNRERILYNLSFTDLGMKKNRDKSFKMHIRGPKRRRKHSNGKRIGTAGRMCFDTREGALRTAGLDWSSSSKKHVYNAQD